MAKRISIKVYDDEVSIDESIMELKFNLFNNDKKIIEMSLNNDDSNNIDIIVKSEQIERKFNDNSIEKEKLNFWDKVLNM